MEGDVFRVSLSSQQGRELTVQCSDVEVTFKTSASQTHHAVKLLLLLYIEFTISFLIGRKRTVNFRISACDVI